jgi:hypothetical protein
MRRRHVPDAGKHHDDDLDDGAHHDDDDGLAQRGLRGPAPLVTVAG